MLGVPHLYFGKRLSKARQKLGLQNQELVQQLNIDQTVYENFEKGIQLPTFSQMATLAHVLKVDMNELQEWVNTPARALPPEEKSVVLTSSPPTIHYLEKLDAAIEQFQVFYDFLPTKHAMKTALQKVRQEMETLTTLPFLPMNLFFLLDVLQREGSQLTYLRECKSSISEDETLADYLARQPHWGTFIFYQANQIFAQDKPFQSLEECIQNLSFDQLKKLVYIASSRGIYSNYGELHWLQQQIEFASMAALMARDLRAHTQSYLNPNHLSMAILLQNIGEYALYTILKPSLWNGSDQSQLGSTEFQRINYELHSVVGAVLAARWNFPEEVLEAILMHHHPALEEVNPLCATMKIFSFFADTGFGSFSLPAIEKLLNKTPQVRLPAKAVFDLLTKLQEKRAHCVEMSATVLEKNSEASGHYAQSISTKKGPVIDTKDFRYEPEYQKELLQECDILLKQFQANMTKRSPNESMSQYIERMLTLKGGIAYINHPKVDSLSMNFEIPIEEFLSFFRTPPSTP